MIALSVNISYLYSRKPIKTQSVMTVNQLICELQKISDKGANVYFRKGKTLNAVTIVRKNSHAEWIVELTNEESEAIR